MVLLLLTLVAVYLRINRVVAGGNSYDKLFIKLSFNLYLAWISVAVLANFNVLLYDIGWLGVGFGSILFTILMIIIGAAVALIMLFLRGDNIFPLVFAWAFIGIAVLHGSEIVNQRSFLCRLFR
jgi:translocator protein